MLRSSTGAQCATSADTLCAVSSVSVGAARAASPAPTRTQPRVKGKARPQAQPYREGTGYAIRAYHKGHEIYLSGYPSEAAIKREVGERRNQIDKHGAPKGRGPDATTAAQALQDYAMERLRFKKGAVQEAVRINHYLRAAHLDTLLVTPLPAVVPESPAAPEPARGSAKAPSKVKKPSTVYFSVTLQPYQAERVIANGLHAHRKAQLTKTADARKHRAVLATKRLGSITRGDMQGYMDAMRDEGTAPATMKLEQSLWRVLFNHAFTKWAWASLQDNPATRLEMPAVDNERDRVLSLDEQKLLDAALAQCRNDLAGPTVTLLRETAMRSSEQLETAKWQDVDWERRILRLTDAKTGKREVPLSPVALQVLRQLGPGEPTERIVKISYEALKAAWTRACVRAGLTDLKLHDLRHTAATRMALKTGNVWLVKALTGHLSDVSVARYVNVKAADVVEVMHAPEPAAAQPAGAPASEPTVAATTAQAMATAAPAVQQPTFTLEQMQAMAQLAAQAAIAGLNTDKPMPPASVQTAPLTLVPPPAPQAPTAVVSVLRRAA